MAADGLSPALRSGQGSSFSRSAALAAAAAAAAVAAAAPLPPPPPPPSVPFLLLLPVRGGEALVTPLCWPLRPAGRAGGSGGDEVEDGGRPAGLRSGVPLRVPPPCRFPSLWQKKNAAAFFCLGAGSLKGRPGTKAESQRLLYGGTGQEEWGSRTGVDGSACMRGMCSKPWLRLESWLVSHAAPSYRACWERSPGVFCFSWGIFSKDFTLHPVGMGGVIVGGGALFPAASKGLWEPMGLLRCGLALRIKSDLAKKVSQKMPMDPGHPLSPTLEGSESQTLGLICLVLCKG